MSASASSPGPGQANVSFSVPSTRSSGTIQNVTIVFNGSSSACVPGVTGQIVNGTYAVTAGELEQPSGGSFAWSVTSNYSNGSYSEGSGTLVVAAEPPTPTPSAPASLTVTVGGSSNTLSWPAVTPASGGTIKYDVERGTTVIATGLTATTYTDTSPGSSGPVTYGVRSTQTVQYTQGPSRSSYTTATSNVAPNAPTLTSPANNSTLDNTAVQRFAWTFSDPNTGDSQSQFDLRYSSDGGSTWATVTRATAAGFNDFAAGTFTAGAYQWQVRTYDSRGVVGPWSASSFFTAAVPPSGPSITYPTSGGTVNASDSVTWSYATQTDYQVRRVADTAGAADTSTIYFDSGDVVDATARTLPLSFPTNNRYEHIQIRVKSGGLWSAYVDVRVLVSYTPPAAPTVTIGPGQPDLDGYVSTLVAAYLTPAASGSIPTATSALLEYSPDGGTTVERSVRTINVTGADTFWTPASGVDYSVRVTVTADNGTSATSGWVNTPDSSGGTGGTGGTGGGGTTGNVAYGQGAYGVGPDD